MQLPWTQLSASPCTVLFRWKSVVDHIDHAAPCREHQGGGRQRGLGRGRRRAGEDATVEARAERSTRVHRFGCGVRLPSPQNNRGWVSRVMPWPAVGVVGGAEACAAAQPATGGGSRWSRRRCFGGWSKKIRD